MPLYLTHVEPAHSILWQLDIDLDPVIGEMRRHIKIWDIGNRFDETITCVAALRQDNIPGLSEACRVSIDVSPILEDRLREHFRKQLKNPESSNTNSESLELACMYIFFNTEK